MMCRENSKRRSPSDGCQKLRPFSSESVRAMGLVRGSWHDAQRRAKTGWAAGVSGQSRSLLSVFLVVDVPADAAGAQGRVGAGIGGADVEPKLHDAALALGRLHVVMAAGEQSSSTATRRCPASAGRSCSAAGCGRRPVAARRSACNSCARTSGRDRRRESRRRRAGRSRGSAGSCDRGSAARRGGSRPGRARR